MLCPGRNLGLIAACLFLSGNCALFAETGRAAVNFGAPVDSGGWSVDNPSLWEKAGGALRMKTSGDSTGNWLRHRVVLDHARTDGDFTFIARAGFSGAAYPMADDSTLSWKIYYRAMAFGIMTDSANALLATFCRTNGQRNGILRLVNGKEIWLCRPYSGQGVGLDVHDTREFRMTREGRKIIVWAGGGMVYMAEDTLSGGLAEGYPVVCGPGPVGLSVERIAVQPEWHGQFTQVFRPLPPVENPPEISSLTLPIERGGERGGPRKYVGTSNGTWHLISTEAGEIKGDTLGSMVPEGVEPLAWSWAARGGQFNVQNIVFGSAITIETWFKLVEVPKQGLPLIQLVFDGSAQDSAWSGRERGGPMAFQYPDSTLGLHFHEFGGVTADIPGVFRLDEWTHLAWVRRGRIHSIFVNGKEVFATLIPRYGERTIRGIQLTLGQNADHDWITRPGPTYALFDCFRLSDKALEPAEFVSTFWISAPFNRPYNFNPFSPDPHIPIEITGEKKVSVKFYDREGTEIFTYYEGVLQPGKYTIYFYSISDRFNKGGLYFYRLYIEGEKILERNITIVKFTPRGGFGG